MKFLTLDGLTYYIGKIKAWISDNFVAKVEGKGLSTNDYTTTEKTKLSGIATGAQVNKIESVKLNGTALTISSKAVNIDLSNYATKGDVSAIPKFAVTVVESLPTSNISTSTIYLVPNGESGTNAHDEYIRAGDAWEKIGTTEVDLSGYYTSSQVDTKLGTKQNTLTAGTNITISGNTISAKDTTYSAATTSVAGLMSADDKTKLNGIATGATKVTVDSALSSSSTNPVQNKVINSALAGKLSTSGTAAKATADANGNNIASTYETKANAITGLSVSGKTITYTKGNGTTGTITTQDTNSDTKNTAGSTDSSSKLFLIGATSQAASPQTYSHDTAYVGTDGCLYSGGVKVATTGDLTAITNAEIDAAFEA